MNKNYLDCYIVKDESNEGYEKYYGLFCKIIGYGMIVLSVLMIICLWRSVKKYKQITRRNPTLAWDQTYCLLSKYLVMMVMTGTLLCLSTAITNAIIYLRKYEMETNDDGIEICDYGYLIDGGIMNYLYIVLTTIYDYINFT